MRFDQEEYEENLDFLLSLAGVSNEIPEPKACSSEMELSLWFRQFGRAARAARLHPIG